MLEKGKVTSVLDPKNDHTDINSYPNHACLQISQLLHDVKLVISLRMDRSFTGPLHRSDGCVGSMGRVRECLGDLGRAWQRDDECFR